MSRNENDFMQCFQAKSNMDIKNLDLKDASSHCSDIKITEAFVEDVVVKEEAVEIFEDEVETSFEYVAVKEEAESSAVVVKHEVGDDSAESDEVVQPVLETKEESEIKFQVCLKRFKRSLLKKHMVCHTEGRQHERRGKKLKTAKTLKTHIEVHEEVLDYGCEYCEKRFINRYWLGKHLLSHPKPYRCEICHHRLGEKTHLTMHMDRHTGNHCTVCGKSFNSEDTLTVHKCVGLVKRPHQCDKCPKKYTTLSNLTIHQKTHFVENFKCEFCNKVFHRKLNLILHVKTMHKDVDLDIVVVKPINPSFNDDVEKERKKKKVEDFAAVDESITVVKHEVDDYSSESVEVLRPENTVLDSKVEPSADESITVVKHDVDDCSSESVEVSRPDSKLHRCEICARRFIRKCNLKVHLRTHTSKQPHVCTVCDKAFHWKWMLQDHARVHSKERPYQCDMCHKRFGRLRCLVVHRKKHFRFKNQQIMKMHNDVDINTVVIKPFQEKIGIPSKQYFLLE